MTSIALVGRSNVGKSSLFNILSKSRKALVADIPGLTRDRNYAKVLINEKTIWLIDSGGFEPKNNDIIYSKMSDQTKIAIDECDLIFFIVDARVGCHHTDEEIADFLRKKNKKTILIINKTEGRNKDLIYPEFSKLGFKNYINISASHNEGILELKNLIFETIVNFDSDVFFEGKQISLSILGKPNVGKSTLVNSFLGEERFLAIDQPGTTRDAISSEFQFNNKCFLITDTAGIRKKGKVTNVIEKFSVLKAIKAIETANVCILVIDSLEGIGQQDLQILSYILEEQKPLVIAINKWDKLDPYKKNQFKDNLEKKLSFIKNIEKIFISASKKIGLKALLNATLLAYESSCKKISTPVLNQFLKDIQLIHMPPINKGIRPKLKYAHQGGINPPNIIIHGNHLREIKKDYIKFLESSFIKTFGLIGTPLMINFKEGKNPYIKNEMKPVKTGLVTRRRLVNQSREKLKIKNSNN